MSRFKAEPGDKDSIKIIKKQRATIDKLSKDNAQLQKELDLDKSMASSLQRTKTPMDTHASMSAHLSKLHDQAETYTKKIESERRRIEELDSSIKELNAQVLEQRKKLGGANAVRENNIKTQKQIQILENRLDKSLLKFNEALAHNKQLRESIDNLRRERQAFDNIYKKLEKDLTEKKQEMTKIVELSNVAYEVRDRAQQEMVMLKMQADKEQEKFERDWKELGKLIENDRKMKELMRQREKAGIGPGGKVEDEDKLRKKIIKGNAVISRDKEAQQKALQKVQSYEEAFAKIQQSTGISDIDELVATFIEAEDKNFSLFNYVNELNNEVEKLEEQIDMTRREILRYRGVGENRDDHRKRMLQDLEDKLAKTEAKAEQYEARAARTMATVNELKKGIEDTFNRIGCNSEGVSAALGNQGVTESNMMQYLGIIEQRTNEILQMYVAVKMQEEGQDISSAELQAQLASIAGHGPAVPLGAGEVKVTPPSAGDDVDSEEDSDEEEEDDHPLSREELKAKTLRNLARRESMDRDGGTEIRKTPKRRSVN
jgi:chromosome segregation ATPase